MTLHGSIALVTGVSHDAGIGAAVCHGLAREGADIIFAHWKADEGWVEHFQKEITSRYRVKCIGIEADLSKAESPPKLLDETADLLGSPDILINNAAYSTRDGFMRLDAETLDAHYAVNVRGTCLLSVAFARRFLKEGKQTGRIINLTSGQDLGPMTGELAYGATKGAVSAFTLSLSAELASAGITVNAVNPGPTDTGWMTEEIKKHLEPKFLSGRMGRPEDAARLITFLATEEAGWITGQVINSEGGFLRS